MADSILSRSEMKAAEVVLAVGLACAALAAALCQFVMIGLIGLALFPLALALLLLAAVLAPAAENLSWRQRGVSWFFYALGIVLLLATAGFASGLAFEAVDGAGHFRGEVTNLSLWAMLVLASPLPPLAIALGLRYRTAWPWRRCAFWGATAFCVSPVAVVLFWLLAPIWPLTA